jgi:hypothetical protein
VRTALVLALALCALFPSMNLANAIGCTPQQAAQCASLPLADTCTYFQCVLEPGPAGRQSFDCVPNHRAANTLCHSNVACITAGTCGSTGGCNANPGQRVQCQDTSTGIHDPAMCWCSNFSCDALIPPRTLLFGASAAKYCVKASPGG